MAGSGQGGQALVAAGDEVGPGPSLREAQDASAAGSDESTGHGQEPQSQAFGFPGLGGLLRPGQQLGPGEQLGGELDQLKPDLIFANACSGRLAIPVSLSARMRSSARARSRWRSSSSASRPPRVLVANMVIRQPW